MERRMKMMKKKLLGLGRKRKEEEGEEGRQRPQARSGASSSSLGGYKVRSRDLGRLHRAAALGDLSELRQLLRKHDRNEQDEAGRTPLHLACANGCTDVVAFLLDCKCKLNIYDSDKRSPLMKAVQCQQEDCAILLLENGADPNLMDIDKNTALHFAVFNSSISIASHLLDHNAQIEDQNKDGSTPLLVAATENNQEMAAFLLKKGASVHATDKLGRTALLIATFNKKRVLTHLLLSYGSDVSHKDDSGWSAHDYAVLSDDPILLQYIMEHCKEKTGAENSSEDRKVLAVLNSPDRADEAGFALGLPAANKEEREMPHPSSQAAGDSGEVIDDHSSGDSVRDSEKMEDDSWLSSEEEELEFSPKKPQKQSLAQLINVAQQFKKNLDQKSSLFGTERVASSQQNRSVCDAVDATETFPKPLAQVQSFPQPTCPMPGSFSKHFRTSSPLASKQEDFLEEEEGKNQGMNENLICRRSSENQISSQDAIVRKGMEEEDEAGESPWDSEPEITKTNLERDATPAPLSKPEKTKEKQKQDLMEELGLDDADDIEDPSDWDSSSISQGVSGPNTDRFLISGDHLFPGQLATNSAATRMSIPASIQEGTSPATKLVSKDPPGDEENTKEFDNGKDKVEEGKRNLELKERKVANMEGKSGQESPVDENLSVKTEDELKDGIPEENQAANMISSSDKEASLPVPYQRFSLKREEEQKRGVEMLYEQTLDQLRKKEEQYCMQVEEKQQMELRLRSLEMELRALKNHLTQVEEERSETWRQLSQEQNARALQEEILKTHLQRQKELEEEISKKATVECSEVDDHRGREEELIRGARTQQELDSMRLQHEEEASRYLEENEALKAKIAELEKALKLSKEAVAQTVFQYTGQVNVSKTEAAMLASKLEHLKENKESLEAELDSFHSRLKATVQELEECQVSQKDLERTLHRERDEWLRSKDSMDRDVRVLQESNSGLSQQLGKAESKANGLENELQLVTRSLREKNLLLEDAQRNLIQAQKRVKELENDSRVEKEQLNKYTVKQDSLQERLAQLQSENFLLRQQHEDFQNKGILKEKAASDVQDKISDLFGQLRVDNEKLVRVMEGRNEELIAQCDTLKEQVMKCEAEKADREGTIRQLQQELADSLKKQSMSEASLEVSTRYRTDLEEEKQQLQKEMDRVKSKLQQSEERYLQSERCIHDLKRALDSKDHEANVTSQKLQDLLVASSGANNAIKQLEEHVKRLEVENARLEATTNHQSNRIEILQTDLKESASVHSRLEELITGLQTAQINLEEQRNQQVEKQTPHSIVAKDTHSIQEEVKSRLELGVRLSELEREKSELMAQFENEAKKVKKLAELKRSVETRLDQEIKRNRDLQKECNRIKKLAIATRKKLKQYESEERSLQSSLHGEIKNKYSEIDIEMGMLRKKVDELSNHLEAESTRCTQMEAANCELREQLSSMKLLKKNYEELQNSKLHLEEEIVGLKRQIQASMIDFNQVEQYKRDVKERAKQEVTQKLEEVNLLLQTQAASQETLEQVRATHTASLRTQLENKVKDLEWELDKVKRSQQDSFVQKESELERYKRLCSEEIKMRKSLGRKLDRANEKLAETNARLCRERHKSKSLLTSTFLSGNLSGNPIMETAQLGNLESSLALNRPLSLGGFINPTRSPLASKSRVDDYLVKMQMELERNITKELEQVNTELDAASARISPIGSVGGASKNLNMEQDQVSKATQQYLDVLKKNYMI